MPARVKGKDLMHLSRQLAAFLRAGIPILDGLALLARDTSNATLRRTLDDVAERLRQGSPLGEAFDHHPKVFPEAYRSMVRSAELTGNLDVVLERLTVYVEREVEARRKIRSAMSYPMVVVVLSVAVSLLLVTFVLPKFRVFFASFDQELPLPTRMLLGISDAFQHWWWAFLVAAVLAGLGSWRFLRSPRGRLTRDRVVLRLPVLGKALQYSVVERFARVFSAMLQAGVPLGEAMDVAAGATNNGPAKIALATARGRMLSGEGISEPLADTGIFPAAAVQMIRVGEDTGSLDEQLDVVAGFYEKELDEKVKQITTLMEPAVLLIMGSIVGFVALALVSAMYGIYGSVGS
ncbi:MAG TPA: type II secretion system F family protein [Actinomycetes bacterium]